MITGGAYRTRAARGRASTTTTCSPTTGAARCSSPRPGTSGRRCTDPGDGRRRPHRHGVLQAGWLLRPLLHDLRRQRAAPQGDRARAERRPARRHRHEVHRRAARPACSTPAPAPAWPPASCRPAPPSRSRSPAASCPTTPQAVALNLTATQTDGPGFVTAWPTGQAATAPRRASNVSAAGETAANAVVVPVGQGGQVNFFTFAGTHLVADVTGYFSDRRGDHRRPLPRRAERADPPDGHPHRHRRQVGRLRRRRAVRSAGRRASGVPADATAVALTVTYTGPTAAGFLTVWPTGQPRPLASTTNPNGVGDIRSNLALVAVGTGGKVSVFSFAPTDVVVDVVGCFSPGTGDLGPVHHRHPRSASRIHGCRRRRSVASPVAARPSMDFTNFVAPGSGGALVQPHRHEHRRGWLPDGAPVGLGGARGVVGELVGGEPAPGGTHRSRRWRRPARSACSPSPAPTP